MHRLLLCMHEQGCKGGSSQSQGASIAQALLGCAPGKQAAMLAFACASTAGSVASTFISNVSNEQGRDRLAPGTPRLRRLGKRYPRLAVLVDRGHQSTAASGVSLLCLQQDSSCHVKKSMLDTPYVGHVLDRPAHVRVKTPYGMLL